MIYLIPGLGADYRIFGNFQWADGCKILNWERPNPNESLTAYATRLSQQIDTTKPFSLLGVSFGGLVAQEIASIYAVDKVFLVSSVSSRSQMPIYLNILQKIPLHRFISLKIMQIFNLATAQYYFGTKSKSELTLLKQIIKDTDQIFLRWAIEKVVYWQKPELINGTLIRIHGNADKIFPFKGKVDYVIEDGTHWMMADRTNEIIEILKSETFIN